MFFGSEYKVMRGGSFAVSPVACRGTFRNWDYPIRRQIFSGFRTARSAGRGDPSPGPPLGDRLMCRHLAYLGPPASLRSVLIDPPHGLYQQAWAPRRQRHGAVNADGFGVGWYAPDDPDPARYRHAGPMWADESFADLARVIRAGAMLAAVRSATPGTDHGAATIAPFASGQWLFSHNGKVEGWPESVAGLAATLPAAALLELEARVDSALLWAMVLARLRGGAGPAEAIADTAGA